MAPQAHGLAVQPRNTCVHSLLILTTVRPRSPARSRGTGPDDGRGDPTAWRRGRRAEGEHRQPSGAEDAGGPAPRSAGRRSTAARTWTVRTVDPPTAEEASP